LHLFILIFLVFLVVISNFMIIHLLVNFQKTLNKWDKIGTQIVTPKLFTMDDFIKSVTTQKKIYLGKIE
jgi:hypothetical protein